MQAHPAIGSGFPDEHDDGDACAPAGLRLGTRHRREGIIGPRRKR